ncbi:LLM class flavin-dependent oxidoreductase [Hymenobacter sp. BT507]|uniref:LLM class flavin-dependent oxidoreductase n=1 Tax=Hymenobacter citatus TaxID=2763506 RepID=A0ABR7MFQ8_9BACT|nr:LLM class flavin-dependent oxidoreductase [Hymenobacter citatus]MBC6609904.1 LLM class flavin-dependent oxidoreductase [Hymenobacter citatus]
MKTPSSIRLSVLDQSPVRQGGTARQALLETVQLAQHAEALGYTRFWVSEHHNSESLAGTTPEVLMAHLAGQTQHIRIGSGGVMLPHYSALKVAENFRLLEGLFPNRIDLGIGRAPGADRLTAQVLNPSNQFSEQDFIEQLMDLDRYLTDRADPETIQTKIKAAPLIDTVPELWLLSSSGQSGLFAAYLGMAFTFAHFINPHGGPEAVQQYREKFRPSTRLPRPEASMAIFVLCADTEEKAQELEDTLALQMTLLETGMRGPIPPYATVRDYPLASAQRARLEYNRQRMVSGTPLQVKMQLEKLAAEYGVEEIIAVTITYDFQDRLRSYELLAEAFALQPSTAVQPTLV